MEFLRCDTKHRSGSSDTGILTLLHIQYHESHNEPDSSLGRMASKSAVQTTCHSCLTTTVTLTTAKIEMEEENGKKSDAYYPEIIEIMPGRKFTSAYIAHHPEIYQQDDGNHYGAFDFHVSSLGDSSESSTR